MNGIDPYHDIAGIKVNDTKIEKGEDYELIFDEDQQSSEKSNLTIIGQSEVNKISVADVNGVFIVPQTLIRLRNSKDFVND